MLLLSKSTIACIYTQIGEYNSGYDLLVSKAKYDIKKILPTGTSYVYRILFDLAKSNELENVRELQILVSAFVFCTLLFILY